MRAPDLIDELYDASYGRLVVQMLALCGSQGDAEDAVQEAFVQALRHRDRLAFVDRPEAWLRTVALNHLRNRWRHAQVVRRLQVKVPGPPAGARAGPPAPREHGPRRHLGGAGAAGAVGHGHLRPRRLAVVDRGLAVLGDSLSPAHPPSAVRTAWAAAAARSSVGRTPPTSCT